MLKAAPAKIMQCIIAENKEEPNRHAVLSEEVSDDEEDEMSTMPKKEKEEAKKAAKKGDAMNANQMSMKDFNAVLEKVAQ